MRSPVMDCANRVYEEMIRMVPQCVNERAKRFPKVIQQIKLILGEMLHNNYETSIRILEQYMDIQSESAITAKADFYELMEASIQSLKVNDMGKLPKDFLLTASERELLKSCDEDKSFNLTISEEAVDKALNEAVNSDDEVEEANDNASLNGFANSHSE